MGKQTILLLKGKKPTAQLPEPAEPAEIQAAPDLPKLEGRAEFPELEGHITDIRGYIEEGLKAAHQEAEEIETRKAA